MAPSKKTRPSEPAELPELNRHLQFGGWQHVGLALIMLIPVLAALKVFGEASTTVGDRGAIISMSVEYPARVRHGTLEAVTVLITNQGPSPLDTVTVRFDTSYVARFTDLEFVPSVARAYEVGLAGVASGETRLVQLAVRANEYGRHRGSIAAIHAADSARVSISTVVFP